MPNSEREAGEGNSGLIAPWSLQARWGIRGACVCAREQGERRSRRGKVGDEEGKGKNMKDGQVTYGKTPSSWLNSRTINTLFGGSRTQNNPGLFPTLTT